MLDQLRRNSRSFIIWILFGIIIAVFIINFGPQSSPDNLGCGYAGDSALQVAGQEVPITSWRFAMNGLRGGGQSAMRRQQSVDYLVERELLAQAAEKQGFRISDDDINQSIAAGEFYVMGHFFRMDDPGFWNSYEQLERFAGQLGINVTQLADEQKRERLAEMMRNALAGSATVAEEEARQYYVHQNTKVTADYVKFDVRRYRTALQLVDEDIRRYASAHDDELKKLWETEKAQWASDKPRVLARQIFIAKDAAKPADEKPADDKAEAEKRPEDKAKSADAKAGQEKKPDEKKADDKAPALQRAKAAQVRVAGGADFAAVAREVSEDRTSRSQGGLLGWRPADSLGQGKEVVEAAKKLEVGKVSDVIESERGYHIIRIEDRSEKGLTFEQKRTELATKLAQDHYARALARRDAEQALAQAKEKPLDQLFERKEAPERPAGMGGQELPPEVLEQLEQLKRQGIDLQTAPAPDAPADTPDPIDGKQGAILREGPNVLAQSGEAPKPAEKPAAKPVASATAEKPADQAAAAGAAELPTATVEKPPLQSVGPVSRMGDFLAGLGKSEKLVSDLFEKLEVGKVAPEVYELGDQGAGGESFAVVLLKAREAADLGKFDESRTVIVDNMTYEKGVMRVTDWVKQRCEEVSKSGEIKVSRELFSEGEEPADKQPSYQPCATLSQMSVDSQLRNRRFD